MSTDHDLGTRRVSEVEAPHSPPMRRRLMPMNIIAIIIIPIVGIIATFWVKLLLRTFILSIGMFVIAELGITTGYHRHWAHGSFVGSPCLQVGLALMGASALQGSILSWTSYHRAQHRYTDTARDPYSISKGFLYAHMGWLIRQTDETGWETIDISDLQNNSIVQWQHKHYTLLASTLGFAVPALVAGIGWNDAYGGLVYAGFIRLIFNQHATFCVNSVAHYLGDQPYDDDKSPRNSWITAILTFGEGYHNFHHTFPSDYRSSVRWWQYDPTKWFIRICDSIGLASNLRQFSSQEIEKASLRIDVKSLNRRASEVNWGPCLAQLPLLTWEEFMQGCRSNGRRWIVIAGVAYDVAEFIPEHPGGEGWLKSCIGKDATAKFHGGVYAHGAVAHGILQRLAIARIENGVESSPHEKIKDAFDFEPRILSNDVCEKQIGLIGLV